MLISDCSSDLCSSDLFRQLEVLLGRAHFVREKGRVRLSETGQRLLPAITGAFAAMGDAFGALGSDEAEVLTINTVTSFGGSWLSARIGSFQLLYPELAVRMSKIGRAHVLNSSH